jgi:hypothetical protein
MDALSRSQCWNLPKNEINAHNRYWRNLVKTQDQNFLIQCLKGKQIDIDKYIIKNIPELAYQFCWEQMTDNEQLQEKFRYRNSKQNNQDHYDGYTMLEEN